ncbi:MAG: PEP/pyruvate-binding domain-containing protein, partial [Pseudomonadota bacterium]
MDFILNFSQVDKDSLPQVGGKNASLGEMIKAGIRVPPGFAVTTESYVSFINRTGIRDKILNRLSDLDSNDVAALNRAGRDVQALIMGAPVPEEINEAVKKGYVRLCGECGKETVPVAVRSSATAEDLPNASFAGQQDTYLWIQGAGQVMKKVKGCWASLFTPRAISYRAKNHFPHESVFISVGVQQMVNSKAAGVMFTINP